MNPYYDHAGISIFHGDALAVLREMPNESVHCCVTSPPYWGLRDYGTADWEGGDADCQHNARTGELRFTHPVSDKQKSNAGSAGSAGSFCVKCGATRIDNQIGLEKTPEEYVEKIVAIFREVKRVLRADGTLWLNLGDSYTGSGKGGNPEAGKQATNKGSQTVGVLYGKTGDVQRDVAQTNVTRNYDGLPPKNLVGIPWRVAFALQADGWILRQDIIWCLSGGAFVYARTQKGDMPLMVRDVARLAPDTVKLWNGEKWTQVCGWSHSKRSGTEIEIVLRSGERIGCTTTHQWPTNRGLLKTSDLSVGDLLESVAIPEPEYPLDTETISRDVAWFVGLYIAEGSRSKDKIQISGHVKETERWERCKRIAHEWGGTASQDFSGNGMNIRIYGKFLNTIIEQFVSGRTAKNKCLAPVCWRYSNEWLRSLLDGYLGGDGGWDTENKRWRLGFCRNYNLERDLRTLAARLSFRLVLNPGFSTFNGRKFPAFHGEIRFEASGHHNCKSPQEIVEIRKARCREVYDIGVADDPHTYALASGILTHNSKPNPMPESVLDRCTKSHEYVFLLSKSARYYFNQDTISEPFESDPPKKLRDVKTEDYASNGRLTPLGGIPRTGYSERGTRNKRSVWNVATEPFPEAHFATYPTDLVRPCILAGCPSGGTVLDPFGGAMTTMLVSKEVGCKGVAIELNAEYIEIGMRRLEQNVLTFESGFIL